MIGPKIPSPHVRVIYAFAVMASLSAPERRKTPETLNFRQGREPIWLGRSRTPPLAIAIR